MDRHGKPETAQESSLISLLRSSSSSSSTSSLYSPSSTAEDVRRSPSPVRTGSNETIQGMGFINLVGHSGMEWKDVERRFDQVASTGNGPEPVVKWPDFGFCIGMQQSPEFANELLRALRGGKDWKTYITKMDMHNFWSRMKDDCFDSRMRIFFDM